MNGAGLDLSLKKWFDFKIPATSIPPHYILDQIENTVDKKNLHAELYWIGIQPDLSQKKMNQKAKLKLCTKNNQLTLDLSYELGLWLHGQLSTVMITENHQKITLDAFKEGFTANQLADFDVFMKSSLIKKLRKMGLLII